MVSETEATPQASTDKFEVSAYRCVWKYKELIEIHIRWGFSDLPSHWQVQYILLASLPEHYDAPLLLALKPVSCIIPITLDRRWQKRTTAASRRTRAQVFFSRVTGLPGKRGYRINRGKQTKGERDRESPVWVLVASRAEQIAEQNAELSTAILLCRTWRGPFSQRDSAERACTRI